MGISFNRVRVLSMCPVAGEEWLCACSANAFINAELLYLGGRRFGCCSEAVNTTVDVLHDCLDTVCREGNDYPAG